MNQKPAKLILLLLLPVLLLTGCFLLDHEEILAVPFDFSEYEKLSDGIYEGFFDGGSKGWRTNRSKIEIEEGLIIDVTYLESLELELDDDFFKILEERILERQSLNIDAVSGASITTRAHLLSVQDALYKSLGK